jgi:uncharacterized protein YbcI
MPEGARALRGTQAVTVSNRMVQLLSRYTGRGPTRTRAVVNTNVAVVCFQDTLTKGELNLVEAGEAEAVHVMRRTFHDIMREEAVAAVEEVLEREVMAFMSDVDVSANCATMVFMLTPHPETGDVQTAETGPGPDTT